jgi:hypothetical protein
VSRIERRYPLNVAQLRNLRSWSPDERPTKVIAIMLPLAPSRTYEDSVRALHGLLARHEALRSRVVGIDTECPFLEVLEPGEAAAQLAIDLVETSALAVDGAESSRSEEIEPRRCAAHCTLFSHAGYVHAIKLSVSHVFTDAFGFQALLDDLKAIIHDDPASIQESPSQASLYARGPGDPRVRSNTEKWQQLLTDVPRSCTYSGSPREQFEMVEYVDRPLAAADIEYVKNASREVKASPYIVWSAIISSLVELIAGEPKQVFRSTYANRFTPSDYSAVAQLAQAVYLPIDGREGDSFRARARQVADVTLLTYEWGNYDAIGLLDWLNDVGRARGAIFQPAFELNYVPPAGRSGISDILGRPAPPEPRTFQSLMRIDPPSAKADLAVSVSYEPSALVRFSFRRPVSEVRTPMDLADDCFRLMRHLCADPDLIIRNVPIRPLVPAQSLCRGHHSGVAVDLAATRGLIESFPGVTRCSLEMRCDGADDAKLHAQVLTSAPVSHSAMLDELTRRQPWLAGSIVPDQVQITRAELSADGDHVPCRFPVRRHQTTTSAVASSCGLPRRSGRARSASRVCSMSHRGPRLTRSGKTVAQDRP